MRAPPFWLFGALSLFGCASEPQHANGGTGGQSATGGASGSGGSSASGGSTVLCKAGPGYTDDRVAQRVDSVSAQLLDLDEQPLSFEFVQVCGDICVQGKSTESGGVVVSVQQDITKPAFKFGEGKVSARFARLLPDRPRVEFGVIHSVRLPELGTGVALVAGMEASMGGLSLFPEAGSTIRIDKLTFEEVEEQKLRAVQVPLDRAQDLIEPKLGLELLYAATPTSTQFCPPVRLSVDNSEGWAAGTEVEVLLHGVEIDEQWAPYGGWTKVSDAAVSSDGLLIETTSPGLPLLGVLGFRRK